MSTIFFVDFVMMDSGWAVVIPPFAKSAKDGAGCDVMVWAKKATAKTTRDPSLRSG
jgi:hypothetical protein